MLTDAVNIFRAMEFNPCKGIRITSKDKYEYYWLGTRHEIEFYLKCWQNKGLFLAVYITLMLGLRRSEVLALQWRDIDFKKGIAKIRRVCISGEEGVIIRDYLKNGDNAKELLVLSSLLNYLKYVKGQGNYDLNDYIVLDKNGERWQPSSFSRKFLDMKKTLPVDQDIRFHDLRHSNASYLYSQGVDVKMIQERLGHSDIHTTLMYYTHTKVEDQKRATAFLDF